MTECYALQNTAFVAERLGVPTQAGEGISRPGCSDAAIRTSRRSTSLPQCYDGGPLDHPSAADLCSARITQLLRGVACDAACRDAGFARVSVLTSSFGCWYSLRRYPTVVGMF